MIPPPPSLALHTAVSSLRTVGTVFVTLGGLGCFLALDELKYRKFIGIEIVGSASLFLLTPGVLYHLAAVFIRRHDVKMGLLARRTAIIQSAVGALSILVLALCPNPKPMFLTGAVPILFFIPALLVQAHQIGKALAALRLLPDPQRGFEVLPILPVEEDK